MIHGPMSPLNKYLQIHNTGEPKNHLQAFPYNHLRFSLSSGELLWCCETEIRRIVSVCRQCFFNCETNQHSTYLSANNLSTFSADSLDSATLFSSSWTDASLATS